MEKKPAQSASSKIDFEKDPVDFDYIIGSGLLFQINREILHPLGIAMTVKVDSAGKKAWDFKDSRDDPSKSVYTKESLQMGWGKLKKFLEAFGAKQLKKRLKSLGHTSQHIEPNW